MPKKQYDESEPASVFDTELRQPVSQDELAAICTEFDIEDFKAFSLRFHQWSANYRNSQRLFRDTPSTKVLEENARHIELAAQALANELSKTGSILLNALTVIEAECPTGASNPESSEPHNAAPIQSGTGWTRFDLNAFNVALIQLTRRATQLREQYSGNYADGLKKNPAFDMDRRVLILNIRNFWETELSRPFKRRIEPREDERGRRIATPLNDASKFTVLCAQSIDKALTVDIIDQLMKDNIEAALSKNAKQGIIGP